MADLGNWALERYRIAGEPVSPEEPSPPAADPETGKPRGES
jgi:endogenous inhibitor of DNA gyrase (YacG/DUF329 family)